MERTTSNSNIPTNNLVQALLTDMYQISMCYGYWKSGRAQDHSVYELFFRKLPFKGEYCVFAGLDEVIRYLSTFKISQSDVDYLKTIMPSYCDDAFYSWLLTLDCSEIKIHARRQGSFVFPSEPLIRVEGPLAIAQLLETALLNLINFPSLIATCAARMRVAAGPSSRLLEFGLRRAQGPDGAVSASKYSYVGGFDGTSNVLAGKLFGIDAKGTMAHAYVMCCTSIDDVRIRKLVKADQSEEIDLVDLVLAKKEILGFTSGPSMGELASFITYAIAFPSNFLALVDTYNTLRSGVPNFLAVGWALHDLGYYPVGIRLDSGDLAELSKAVRRMYLEADAKIGKEIFGAKRSDGNGNRVIVSASNDINEDSLYALNRQKHEIDLFGIGTHLVTCQQQPALGCVYKLVELNGTPRIKISEERGKTVLPCAKKVFRFFDEQDKPLLDYISTVQESDPVAHTEVLCRHPSDESKRVMAIPSRVQSELNLVWGAGAESAIGPHSLPSPFDLKACRSLCVEELSVFGERLTRKDGPVGYPVYLSPALYDQLNFLWSTQVPIPVVR